MDLIVCPRCQGRGDVLVMDAYDNPREIQCTCSNGLVSPHKQTIRTKTKSEKQKIMDQAVMAFLDARNRLGSKNGC